MLTQFRLTLIFLIPFGVMIFYQFFPWFLPKRIHLNRENAGIEADFEAQKLSQNQSGLGQEFDFEYLKRHPETVTYYQNQFKQHPEDVLNADGYSLYLSSKGQSKSCEAIISKCLDANLKLNGKNNLDTALAYQSYANYLDKQGRYDESEKNYLQALKIRKEVLGPENIQVYHILRTLAYLKRRQNQISESELYLQKAVSIDKKGYSHHYF